MVDRHRPLPIVGWREWVRLVDLCADPIKVKVDTGARTSSLHAFNLQVATPEVGQAVATFEIHPVQRARGTGHVVRVPVVDFRDVRSSSGHRERRPVIRTPITIGWHRYDIDVTLTSRDEMGFRMLLGRTAVRRKFLVDSGRSYLQGEPQ